MEVNLETMSPSPPVPTGPLNIRDANKTNLRLMVKISSKISTATDRAEVLNFILDSVREVIDYDAAAIFLLDEESQTARYVAGRGYGEAVGIEVVFTNDDGIVGWVISTGESVIAPDVGENPHYLNLRQGTRSQLTVPITIDGKVIGAFNLESDQQDSFTEKELRWLKVLATQVAISIDRANHHQEL